MIRREWICRRCNPHFPCRKSFTGYDGVWAGMSEEELQHCHSPFHKPGTPHKAEFVEVVKDD